MTWPLVFGLGSDHGDDQAGWLVVRRLAELGFPSTHLSTLLHPAELLDRVEADGQLVICDACKATSDLATMNAGKIDAGDSIPLGTDVSRIQRFFWPTDKITYERNSGTHDLPLSTVLELGRQLETFPSTIIIWAIKGHQWRAGSQPSITTVPAANQVADFIWRECRDA